MIKTMTQTRTRARIMTRALVVLMPLLLAAPAVADPGPGGRMTLAQMDRDGDGTITRDEWQMGARGQMADADADGDGLVTRPEWLAAAHQRAEARIDRMFNKTDSNGDGALDTAEMAAMVRIGATDFGAAERRLVRVRGRAMHFPFRCGAVI